MKIVSECREGLWALVQSAISVEPAIDYDASAADRLANCSRLAADPTVNDLLEVVGHRSGPHNECARVHTGTGSALQPSS